MTSTTVRPDRGRGAAAPDVGARPGGGAEAVPPAPTGDEGRAVASGDAGAGLRQVIEWAVVVLAAVVTIASSAPWARAFPGSRAWALLLLASVLSVAVPVVVVRSLRRPLLWSAGPSLVLLLVLLLVAVGDVGGPAGIARGLTEGPKKLWSTTLPITGTGELFVTPFLLVWLVGATIGELIERSSARAAPVVIAVVGFTVAFAMGTGAQGDEIWWAALLLAAALLLVCLRAWLDRPPVPDDAAGAVPTRVRAGSGTSVVSAFSLGYGRVAHDPFDPTEPRRAPEEPRRFAAWRGSRALATRPLRAGAGVVLVVVAAMTWIVPNLAHFQQPETVPERVRPVERDRVVAPLATTAALRQGAAGVPSTGVLFTMTTSGPIAGYVATAQLDAYDGATWRYDRTFEPTGGRVPDDQTVEGSATVAQRYELRALPEVRGGVALPYVTRPRQVTDVDVRYDAGTGMIIPAGDVHEGTSYRVESRVAPVTLEGVDPEKLNADGTFAVVAPSPTDQDYAFPPELDEDLDRWGTSVARETEAAKGATLPFLAAIEQHFHASYARVEEGPADQASGSTSVSTAAADPTPNGTTPGARRATGGTSFAEVAAAIGVDHAGTPEQFATLYALIVRRLGVPARVVTGFHLTPTPPAGALDQKPVTAAEAWTWVEVPVTGVGWVTVDPTPTATVAPAEDRVSAETSTTTTPRQKRTAAVSADTGTPIAPVGDLSQAPGVVAGRSPWVLLVVVLLLAALAAPSTLRIRRELRRRSRQQGNPTERIIGAWLETIDAAARVPVAGLDSMTNTEVVAAVAQLDGNARGPAARLADVANRALFRSARLTPEDADAAWADADDVRSVLAAASGWRGRRRRGGSKGAGAGPDAGPSSGSPPGPGVPGDGPPADAAATRADVLAGGGDWA